MPSTPRRWVADKEFHFSAATVMAATMYFPIVLESEALLLQVCDVLNAHNIFPRRYFYPSLTQYESSATGDPAPIADDVANRILCLPLYFALACEDIERICSLIIDELPETFA